MAAALPTWAETHTLQPYAYVQSHGVNRVDTGYCAKLVAKGETVYVSIPKGFMVIVK